MVSGSLKSRNHCNYSGFWMWQIATDSKPPTATTQALALRFFTFKNCYFSQNDFRINICKKCRPMSFWKKIRYLRGYRFFGGWFFGIYFFKKNIFEKKTLSTKKNIFFKQSDLGERHRFWEKIFSKFSLLRKIGAQREA